MNYIPAISLLTAFLIAFVAVLRKFTNDQLLKIFIGKNFLLLSSFLLFLILLVVHLFQNQDWTADVLKVLAGVFVGVSATFASDSEKNKNEGEHGVDMGSSQFGDGNQIAGRDILNQTIDKVFKEIQNVRSYMSQIKDSVVNQYPIIQSTLDDITSQTENSRRITRRSSVEIKVTTPNELEKLQSLIKRGVKMTDDKYLNFILSSGEFQRKLRQKIDEYEKNQWKVKSIRLSDTSNFDGFYFEFTLSQDLGSSINY